MIINENTSKNNRTNIRTGKRISGRPPFAIGDMIRAENIRHLFVDVGCDGRLEWFVDCMTCKTRETVKTAPRTKIQEHTCSTCLETEIVVPQKTRRRRRRRVSA